MQDMVSTVRVPIKLRHGVVEVDHPVILPSTMLRRLLQQAPGRLRQPDWEGFWQLFRETDPDHPVYARHEGRLGRVLPIMLHGDEGRTKGKRPIMVIALQPVLVAASASHTLDTRWLYTVMPAELYAPGTLESLFTALEADVRRLFENGVDAADGKLWLACIAIKGDWDFLAKALQMRRTYRHARICWRCLASKTGECNYRDTSTGAPWKATIGADPLPWNAPALAGMIANDPARVKPDTMHCFHIGVGRDAVAGIVNGLCEVGAFAGATVEQQLSSAFVDFANWCSANQKSAQPG